MFPTPTAMPITIASEATRRLHGPAAYRHLRRPSAAARSAGDGCPNDIVFSQDVVARHARLEWYPEDARPARPETLNPAQWSRRRPVAAGDR